MIPARSIGHPSPQSTTGMDAYACRQSHTYKTLITSFANQWQGLLAAHELSTTWLQHYPVGVDPLSLKSSHGHSKLQPSECGPVSTGDPSLPTNPPSPPAIIPQLNSPQPGSSIAGSLPDADTGVDPLMDSDGEIDDGSNYVVDEDKGLDFDD